MPISQRRSASDEGFAARLRRARGDAGMSQRDLERTSGIPKSRISRYENGHLLPSLGGLQKLSRSLGVADSELLGEEEDVYSVFTRALRRRGVTIANVRDAETLAARIAEDITRPQPSVVPASR